MEFKKYSERAAELSTLLMKRLENHKFKQITSEIYLNDVMDHVRRFDLGIMQVKQVPLAEYPCFKTEEGGPVPLDISGEQVLKVFLENLLLKDPLVSLIPISETISFFKTRLIGFLSGRLAWWGKKHTPNPNCGTAVHLTITTNTHGLEIEKAPSHFRSWTHFGSPTSPVDDCLPPGYYDFQAVEWDSALQKHKIRYRTSAPRYIGKGPTQTEILPI